MYIVIAVAISGLGAYLTDMNSLQAVVFGIPCGLAGGLLQSK